MVVQSTLTELGDYTLRVTVEYNDAGPQFQPQEPPQQSIPSQQQQLSAAVSVPAASLAHPLAAAPVPSDPLSPTAQPAGKGPVRPSLGSPLVTISGAVPGSDPLGANALTGPPAKPLRPHSQTSPQPQQQQIQHQQQITPPPMYQVQPAETASASAPRLLRKYYRFKVWDTLQIATLCIVTCF